MKRLLKEPLLHFLVLGALLFAGYGLLNRRGEPEPGRIVVTQGKIGNLASAFARVWQRPPSPAELDGLVRDYIREEVFAREAMALGLDRDDTVIRRRLRQKMEFVANDVAAQAEPSEAELREFLAQHPDRFRVEPSFTFRQVYLNPAKHGENLARNTAQLLAQLNRTGGSAGFAAMGDSFMLDNNFAAAPGSEVAKQFGEKFAAKLGEISPGQWQGPVESGYGAHLVYVEERKPGRMPELPEVREQVAREWADDRRRDGNEQFYQDLLKRYAVTIEPLPVAAPANTVDALVRR